MSTAAERGRADRHIVCVSGDDAYAVGCSSKVLIGTVVPTANAMLLAMATKLSGQSRPPSRECELRYPTANAVVC